MPSKQVSEILDQVREMHQRMSTCFRSIQQEASDPNLKILTDYMAEHEDKIDQCIQGYESDGQAAVLDTWLQFGNEEEIIHRITKTSFGELRSPEQLVQTALSIQQDLVQLYRELAEATAVPEVQDLFNSLITLEENKGRHYARAISEMMTG